MAENRCLGRGMKVQSLTRNGTTKKGRMPDLLGEFQELHESRLKRFDDLERNEDNSLKTRIIILEAYINDICEQNEVLLQTVVELEREANERGEILQSKLQKSFRTHKEYMVQTRDLERELWALTIEKARAETIIQDQKLRLDWLNENITKLRTDNCNLNHDIDQLIDVISSARTTGKLEIGNVLFKELTVEQVFGSLHGPASIAHIPDDSNHDLRKLREVLKIKDDAINRLQEDLEHAQKQRITLEQKNCYEDQINQLHEDLLESQAQYSECYNDMVKAEDYIEKLKEENSNLNKLAMSNAEKLSALQQQYHQLELDMLVSQEKHKTSLKMVANRDQAILKLHTEMDTMQEKCSHAIDAEDMKFYNNSKKVTFEEGSDI